MKLTKKTRYIILICSLLIGSYFTINASLAKRVNPSAPTNSYVLKCLRESQYDKSSYYNATLPLIDISKNYKYRIYIDENIPQYNWSSWVANYSWCSGDGTISNPYIIENLYIDAQGSGGIVYIDHSKSHSIIKNCGFLQFSVIVFKSIMIFLSF